MEKLRAILSTLFVTALMSVLMAVPAFAAQGDPSLYAGTAATGSATYYAGANGYYVQGSSSNYLVSGEVSVKVNVHSQRNGSSSIDFHTTVVDGNSTTSARNITVAKILNAISNSSSTTLEFQDYDGNIVPATGSYIYQVYYSGKTYAPTSRYAIDGWMFTVNKKFPLISGTPGSNAQGQAINTTYVTDGDIIDVFWNKADSSTYCADFDRISSASYSSGTLTVNVDFINSYYDSSYVWHISNYAGLNGATVAVYTTSGTYLGSAITDSTGQAQIPVTLSAGTYVIGVAKTWKNVSYTGIIHTQERLVIQ